MNSRIINIVKLVLLLLGFSFDIHGQHKKHFYLDRFENTKINSNKVVKWNTYSDSANGGGSNTKLSYTKDSQLKSRILSFSYSLRKKEYQYPPYAGISFNIPANTFPLEPISGIAYEFKGAQHNFRYLSNNGSDLYTYKKTIKESDEWKTIIIPFAELKQDSWQTQVPLNYFNFGGMTWSVTGNDNDSGSFSIDNLRFIKSENIIKSVSIQDFIHFKKSDSTTIKIFNKTNDSLFGHLKEYKAKSFNYYYSLKTIQRSEIIIDSLIQSLKKSALPSNEKEALATLFHFAVNNIPNDVLLTSKDKRFQWKKKYNSFIIFDSLCTLDKKYYKSLTTLNVLNLWASDIWQFANKYKSPTPKDTSYLSELKLYRFKPNEVITEIGAGPGYFEQRLSKFCDSLKVFVNEIDSNMVSKLDTKLQLLDLYDGKNIQYITILGNDKTSKLADSSVDKIIIKNTFHHFTYPNEMLQDFKRILKKNGRIFIVDILMGEVEKPECTLFLKREVFLKYFRDNGYVLINETPLSYSQSKCFEFRLAD